MFFSGYWSALPSPVAGRDTRHTRSVSLRGVENRHTHTHVFVYLVILLLQALLYVAEALPLRHMHSSLRATLQLAPSELRHTHNTPGA